LLAYRVLEFFVTQERGDPVARETESKVELIITFIQSSRNQFAGVRVYVHALWMHEMQFMRETLLI